MEHEYEIRAVDALHDGEGWYYNQTWKVCDVKSDAKDECSLFLNTLKEKGVWFNLNAICVEYDGCIFEIVDRKTGEPLYCMIPDY